MAASKISAKTDLGSIAAIFDMDGTLIDNTPYHFKSWQILFKKYGRGELTKTTYYNEISGIPVMETLRRVFGKDHDEASLKHLAEEKDTIYKKEYSPFVAPINGLERFLTQMQDAGIKMAIASSATVDNIDFILSKIPIRQYFEVIIDGSMVSKSKPHPQIFLKAAADLDIRYNDCVVFEDSLTGIKAANSARMKVVGITTSHAPQELKPANLIIKDYADLDYRKFLKLFDEH